MADQERGLVIYHDFIMGALSKKGLNGEDMAEISSFASSLVMTREEDSPFRMYLSLMEELGTRWRGKGSLPLHGTWHHAMVAGILLRSLQNHGSDVTDDQVREAMARGGVFPGGVCGFHGICGAATALGSALSVLIGATPLEPGRRSQVMLAVSEVNRRIAERGGKRCCPRATYVAIEAWGEMMEDRDRNLVPEKLAGKCPFHDHNQDCLGESCHYHPGSSDLHKL